MLLFSRGRGDEELRARSIGQSDRDVGGPARNAFTENFSDTEGRHRPAEIPFGGCQVRLRNCNAHCIRRLTMRKGRFNTPAAEIAQRYSESVSFDWRLYRYDIAGSTAHAAALARARIMTRAEHRKIEGGLRAIQQQIESGKFQWDRSHEDVHMNIEAALTKRIGPRRRETADCPQSERPSCAGHEA